MSSIDEQATDRPVAWVTGASRGMGADIAVQFARAGYDLAITARDRQRLEGVAREIEAAGGRALVHPSDLTERPTVIGFAEAALQEFGRVDVVVNNGVYQAAGAFQLVMDTEPDEMINVELGDRGIRAFTVEPGFVAYGDDFEETLRKYPGRPVSPPEAIGPAIVWLVQDDAALRLLSKRVSLPNVTHKQGLLAGWDGPGSNFASTRA